MHDPEGQLKGYQAIPELLVRAGLGTVFAMVGGSNAPWIAHGVAAGTLRLIRTRHEETAVHGASGFARSTAGVGLCSVTRGPGFTNAINALTVAVRGHVPLLLITGESPPTLKKTPQIVDQRGLAAVIGAGFHHVAAADQLESEFWSALEAVHWNGLPQVLSIADGVDEADVAPGDVVPASLRPQARPDPEAVAASVDALMAAERPLILAGMGTLLADCRTQLEDLADLVGAQVATTLMNNRYFEGYPYDLGVCGSWSPQIISEVIGRKDVVLSVGASLNHFTTAGGKVFGGARIIQCEIDENQPFVASAAEFALLGDARQTVDALLVEARNRPPKTGPARELPPTREEIQASILKLDLGHDPNRGLDPHRVYVAFEEKLPPDRVVVTDHGRFQGTLPSLVFARDARSYVIPISYSSIGTGLGTAIGAAIAHPERPVVLFAGDGGFMMSAQDLDAIRLNGIENLTIVIMNDELYGSDMKFLNPLKLPNDIVRQSLPDIPRLAEAFGGQGFVVRSEEDLDDLDLTSPGWRLVDVRTDPRVTGTPF